MLNIFDFSEVFDKRKELFLFTIISKKLADYFTQYNFLKLLYLSKTDKIYKKMFLGTLKVLKNRTRRELLKPQTKLTDLH